MMMSNTLAFLFPGQGVQHVGMGQDFIDVPTINPLYEKASEILGFDLVRLLKSGPEEELSLTRNAQPAIFVDGIARYKLLSQEGIKPAVMLGHSLGEFTALVAGGCLSFHDGLKLVKERGEITNDLNSKGSMTAVLGLNYHEVERALNRNSASVTIANYNSPRQVVLSGEKSNLEEARQVLNGRGAKCIQLDVSAPFHSPLMKDAENKLEALIQKLNFSDPAISILSSVSGNIECTGSRLKQLIENQLTNSVHWVSYINTIVEFGVDTTIEAGPDSTLQKLTNQIAPAINNKTFNEVV